MTTAFGMAWATLHYIVFYRFAIGFAFFFSVLLQFFFPAERWLQVIRKHSGPIPILAAAGLGLTTSPGRQAIENNFFQLVAVKAPLTALVAYLICSHNLTVYYLLMLGPLLGKDVLFSHVLGGVMVFITASLGLSLVFGKTHKPGKLEANEDAAVAQPTVRLERLVRAVGSELWATGPLVLYGLLLGGLIAAWGLSPWHVVPVTLLGSGLTAQVTNAVLGLGVSFLTWMSPVANLFVGTYIWKVGIAHAGLVSFFFASLVSWPRVRLYQRTLGDRQGAVFAIVLALAALAAGLLVALFFHVTGLSIHYKLIAQQML
ncbi:MAG TPA: permease [Methylomirabilota bacterium]|nr:permease [Methylomirabilota bacterium]